MLTAPQRMCLTYLVAVYLPLLNSIRPPASVQLGLAQFACGDACRWTGCEEVFPPMKGTDLGTRNRLNKNRRLPCELMALGKIATDAQVCCFPVVGGIAWYRTVKVLAQHYRKEADRLSGQVQSYRVAPGEEERAMEADLARACDVLVKLVQMEVYF